MRFDDPLEARILNAVAQSCFIQPDELRPDLKLNDLGLDSLAITSVVVEIEAVHSRELTPDEIVSLLQADTLSEFLAHIRALLAPSTLA